MITVLALICKGLTWLVAFVLATFKLFEFFGRKKKLEMLKTELEILKSIPDAWTSKDEVSETIEQNVRETFNPLHVQRNELRRDLLVMGICLIVTCAGGVFYLLTNHKGWALCMATAASIGAFSLYDDFRKLRKIGTRLLLDQHRSRLN